MKYEVIFQPFTERHFIKSFAKKYQGAWDKTRKALELEFTYADFLFDKKIAEIIHVSEDNNIKICKTEFKILGTSFSRHSSGYRCIIAINQINRTVEVLLVYSKTDIPSKNETVTWEMMIKENYPEYKNLV